MSSLAAIVASTTDNVVGLVLSIGLLTYLVLVLVFPERF